MDSRTEGKLSKQTHEIMLSFDDTTQRKFLELFDGNHLTAIDEEFQNYVKQMHSKPYKVKYDQLKKLG